MAARGEEFSDSGWGSADMALGGEDLIGRDQLVIARREQEHGNAYLGEIDAPAEGDECALGEPVLLEQPFDDLEIIGAGQIDGQCALLCRYWESEYRRQPVLHRGIDDP